MRSIGTLPPGKIALLVPSAPRRWGDSAHPRNSMAAWRMVGYMLVPRRLESRFLLRNN